MLRSYGIQLFTGVAQPAFGDTVVSFALSGGRNRYTTLTLNNLNGFKYIKGDRILVGAGTVPAQSFKVENVVSLALNATILQGSLEGATGFAVAAGALTALEDAAAEIVIQAMDGNAAACYVGADNSITTAGLGQVVRRLVAVAAGTAPPAYMMTSSVTANCVRTVDAWVVGAAGDKFIASAVIV